MEKNTWHKSQTYLWKYSLCYIMSYHLFLIISDREKKAAVIVIALEEEAADMSKEETATVAMNIASRQTKRIDLRKFISTFYTNQMSMLKRPERNPSW